MAKPLGAQAAVHVLADGTHHRTGALDVSQATDQVVAAVLDLFRVRRSALFLRNPGSTTLVCVASAGRGSSEAWIGRTLPAGAGVAGRAVAEGRPVRSADPMADPRIALPEWLRERLEEEGLRSVVAVPLTARGEALGALGLLDSAERVFTEDDLRLLSAFADQARIATENARLCAEKDRQLREMMVLAELTRTIGASLDVDTVLQRVADGARELCASDMARIALRDPTSEAVVFRYWAGFRQHGHQPFQMEPGKGVGGQVLLTGRPFRTDDYARDPRISKDFLSVVQAEGILATMAVPIRIAGRMEGLLFVDSRSRPFTDGDEAILLRLANHAAIALNNARLFAAEQATRAAAEVAVQALQASEARQRAILESAHDSIITIDHEGRITEFNPAAEQTFGHRRTEVIGRELAQVVIPPALRDRHRAGLARYLATGQSSLIGKRVEITGMRADGAEFPAELTVSRIRADGPPMFTGFLRDISERKQLEDQFRQAWKMEAVGRLAGEVAHDFNNLLTVITGRSQLLLARLGANDPLRRQVDLIRTTADQAFALTSQLLAFSRKQVLQARALDLNAVVTEMDKMLRRLIGEDIELKTIPGPAPGRVRADPGQIEQVILNLAVNARDAMPRGGRLTLETENVELDEAFARRHPGARPGSYVMLAVTDTGCGMDPETMRHIFEPFFTTKEAGKGAGLGLSMAYGIIKQHQGYIAAESEPGRGSRFTIYLPRVEGAGDAAETATTPPGSPEGSETILLVEDEAGLRDLVREVLQMHGYRVLEAANAGEALLLCERHRDPIHLILTDVGMPLMSGRELAQRLATSRPDMRVLYVSGYTDDAILRHGVSEGTVAFLQKPFTSDALTRKVRSVLDALPEA